MADKPSAPTTPPPAAPAAAGAPGAPGAPAVPGAPVPPRRSPGHRGQDVRDTVAEMTAKAQEISLEAGSKMAAAMKDVIGAAAGLTGFVAESARDLVQYMVRRGQMTQEEADRLIKEAEAHQGTRKPAAQGRSTSAPAKTAAAGRSTSGAKSHAGSSAKAPAKKAPAKKAPASKAPAKKAPAAKAPAKKAAAKKPAAKAGARSKPAKKAARR